MCAMTSQAGNITGNSHVKVRLKTSQLFHQSKGRKTMPRLSKYLNYYMLGALVLKEHVLRARDPILTGAGMGSYRWKLVFIV